MSDASSNTQQCYQASPYLSRIAESLTGDVDLASTQGLQSIIEAVIAYPLNALNNDAGGLSNTEQVTRYLVDSKRQFALYWAQAQLTDSVDFVELGRLQSEFADATIDLALRAAWHSPELKQVTKFLPAITEPVPGLFVLGLGKLGGLDLNFSSDVDLVAYFQADQLPVPSNLGQGYIVNKVLQLMTRILHPNHQTDFVWRVDWRLRPDASSSLLALNTAVGEEYYFFKAMPWHRLALMKARVVAGDLLCGEAFLEKVRPFVWRQNLDFRALDELAHIKKRINLEHPGLRHQRKWREPITEECAGFNVKLGSGGIREIEFVANALQLLWGGKNYKLRCTNTLQALQQLTIAKHLASDSAEQLAQSYQYLRNIENGIQMLNNAQTHIVPTTRMQQEQLLQLLGECAQQSTAFNQDSFEVAWHKLSQTIFEHRQRVNDLFAGFFSEQSDSEKGSSETEEDYELPVDWETRLSDRAKAIVNNWLTGCTDYGLPNTMAVMLEPLSNHLLKTVFEAEADVNESFVRVDQFLSSIPNPEQYFRLLLRRPTLVDSIVPPLLHSPHMGILLKQSPHIIDSLLDPNNTLAFVTDTTLLAQRAEFIFLTQDYGVRLERLRRFVNENLYQYYLFFMRGELSVSAFQRCLTHLAECTLECSLKIAQDQLGLDSLPMVVLGMGKLAMSRMSPLSDLDLIFIFADSMELEQAQKVVSRLQTILTMELKEGIAYELDTRLRPSGKSGPPTVFLQGFRQHHAERAKNWEHIALLPSRVVAGDMDLAEQVMDIKREVFAQSRHQQQWLADAKKMWQRIEKHRIQTVDTDVVNSKLRKGGLMQSEYLAVCHCIDALSPPRGLSDSVEIDDFRALVAATQRSDAQQGALRSGARLNQAIDFWSIVQIWERILGLANKAYSDIPVDYQRLLLAQVDCDSLSSFFARAEQEALWVEQAMTDYFQAQTMTDAELDDWQEKNVEWLA